MAGGHLMQNQNNKESFLHYFRSAISADLPLKTTSAPDNVRI